MSENRKPARKSAPPSKRDPNRSPAKPKNTGWEEALLSCFPPRPRGFISHSDFYRLQEAARQQEEAARAFHGLRPLQP